MVKEEEHAFEDRLHSLEDRDHASERRGHALEEWDRVAIDREVALKWSFTLLIEVDQRGNGHARAL
jgi:hypothetical protein